MVSKRWLKFWFSHIFVFDVYKHFVNNMKFFARPHSLILGNHFFLCTSLKSESLLNKCKVVGAALRKSIDDNCLVCI